MSSIKEKRAAYMRDYRTKGKAGEQDRASFGERANSRIVALSARRARELVYTPTAFIS